jgi:hypothetical protein
LCDNYIVGHTYYTRTIIHRNLPEEFTQRKLKHPCKKNIQEYLKQLKCPSTEDINKEWDSPFIQ